MVDIEVDKPLQLFQRHEVMKLYKLENGENNNLYAVDFGFMQYLNRKYTLGTVNLYRAYVLKMFGKKVNKKRLIEFENPAISVKMINKYLSGKDHVCRAAIKTFLKFLDEEYNSKFVDFDFPYIKPSEEKIVDVLPEKTIHTIIEKLDTEYQFFCKFLYYTGCRISEPISMTASSVNWEEAVINKDDNATLKISKTKSKRERIIPISPTFTKELYQYLTINDRTNKENYIFDFKSTYGQIKVVYRKEYMIRKLKKAKKCRVGYYLNFDTDKELEEYRLNWCRKKYIDKVSRAFQGEFARISLQVTGKRLTPHVLRRSRATSMMNKGVSLIGIRDYLGHRSLTTTEKYLGSSFKQLSEEMLRLGL